MSEQLTIFDQPIETNPRPVVFTPPQRKTYVLRDYQKAASNAAVNFFTGKLGDGNALIVCPTGSGKSLIIADIANKSGALVRAVHSARVQATAPGKHEFTVTLERDYMARQKDALPLSVKSASLYVINGYDEDMLDLMLALTVDQSVMP